MTSKPYNLEVVTELTMYGAALTERSPPVRRDRRALPWANRYCAFSAFCRTFLTGVSLCSTTCLWSVVPSALFSSVVSKRGLPPRLWS